MDSGLPSGAAGAAAELKPRGPFARRVVALMAARLALALLSLAIALVVDTTVEFGISSWRGLYGTVAATFLATAIYGVALPRVRRQELFAAVNIATDVALVSALVHFSGGPDSVFPFLYVLVAVYGALLFDRGGARSARRESGVHRPLRARPCPFSRSCRRS